ncbi:MAG: class I SAM-dependent methyltransferase [Candidatus Pacebacteria bacterium]|nr:class I SAM-dependent methyltransferase [Candidatus Paceibacterota bacterium]MCF7862831.1 class I SAM-dependent methyltransferase [Candidatus Paceibacterota bacterium]
MSYSEESKNKLLQYYNNLISEHTDNNAQAQGWASEDTENARFEIFSKVGDLNNHSVLDVGCGFGDFYSFLKSKRIDCKYTGIDINPEMIKTAETKYPSAQFQVIDFGDNDFTEKFDYIFCSGALSFMVPDYKNFYFAKVKKMFELSKKGVAFNMLTEKNNIKTEDEKLYATYSTQEVLDFCKELTEKVSIQEGYLPNDFTVFLYHI